MTTLANSVNTASADAIFRCYDGSKPLVCPNAFYRFVRKFRHAVCFAVIAATNSKPIRHVFLLRSSIQVFRVNAWRVIAFVKNAKTFRYFTVCQGIRKAMGESASTDPTVSIVVPSGSPKPTTGHAGFVHMLPEADSGIGARPGMRFVTYKRTEQSFSRVHPPSCNMERLFAMRAATNDGPSRIASVRASTRTRAEDTAPHIHAALCNVKRDAALTANPVNHYH